MNAGIQLLPNKKINIPIKILGIVLLNIYL